MNNNNIHQFLLFSTPTSEQTAALNAMERFVQETDSDDFLILCGAAGTGKTSITSALIGYLNANEIDYAMAAPTGRAARIMSSKTQVEANTIHSLIYQPSSNKETGAVEWMLKKNSEETFKIFIIDEASMIKSEKEKGNNGMFTSDNSVLNHLAQYVKDGNKRNKVLFLGDRNQLPPIEEEEARALDAQYLLDNFGWKGSFHYLTEVKRVEDGSYILKNAIKLRQAIDVKSNIVPELSAPRCRNLWGAVDQHMHLVRQGKAEQAVAIARSNKAVSHYNKEFRKSFYSTNVKYLEVGDSLVVLQNWRRNGEVLYNGDHVVVQEVDLNKMIQVAGFHFVPVRLEATALDGSKVIINDLMLMEALINEGGKIDYQQFNKLRAERYRKNRLFQESGYASDDPYVGALQLGYGYAITCNKAQGGEWEHVFVNTFMVKDNKWLYTALTRSSKHLNLF